MSLQKNTPDIYPNKELEGDKYWAMRQSLEDQGFELDTSFEATETAEIQVERYKEKLANQGYEARIIRKPGLIQVLKKKLEKGKEAEDAEIVSVGRQNVEAALEQRAG